MGKINDNFQKEGKTPLLRDILKILIIIGEGFVTDIISFFVI